MSNKQYHELDEYLIDFFDNVFPMQVGKLIRQAREEIGMTQALLAEVLGRRQASLSEIENGKMEPDASTLGKLATILGKPLDYFFPALVRQIHPDLDLTLEEFSVLSEFVRLRSETYQQLAIRQIKTLADYEDEEDYKSLTRNEVNPEEHREWLYYQEGMTALRQQRIARFLSPDLRSESDQEQD